MMVGLFVVTKAYLFQNWHFHVGKIVSLSSTGYYKTPKIYWDQGKLKGHPYFYFTWGAAISEALLDINTGESRIL